MVFLPYTWFKTWRNTRRIACWKRHLNLKAHQIMFERLFKQCDGFALSHAARVRHDAPEYVYGEIDFLAFIALLSLAKPGPDSVFYDLGSGIGKAVIACAMVFDIKKSVGIELFQTLHEGACAQQQRLKKQPDYHHAANKVSFIQQDFLSTDVLDATLIFINATGLIGPTWDKLNQKLATCLPATTIITTTKPLSTPSFHITHQTQVQMSWGVVSAYVHQQGHVQR